VPSENFRKKLKELNKAGEALARAIRLFAMAYGVKKVQEIVG